MKLNDSGKLNMIIIIVIVVLQIAIAAALYFFVFKKDDAKLKPIETEKKKEKPQLEELNDGKTDSKDAKDYLNEYSVFNVNDIVVNPKDSPESFLVVSIAFEYQIKNVNLPNELKNKDLLIKDKILTYFSSKNASELQAIENRELFKSDLKKLINGSLIEGRITNVLFSQYVMQ